MLSQQDKLAIKSVLFADPEATVYAVLDGASIHNLLPMLEHEQPEHCCLYRGELPDDLTAAAPYLVRLLPGSPFGEWLIGEGWGYHWGIFAVSHASFREMRKHFRTFMMVKNPEGQQIYFRYYDPRVLRKFIRTCSQDEAEIMFGPVTSYVMEADHSYSLFQASHIEGHVKTTVTELSAIDPNAAPAGMGTY